MSNSLSPENISFHRGWSSSELLAVAPDLQDRLLGWWYRLTTGRGSAKSTSFAGREATRRMRFFSTVAFFVLIVLLIFFPASLLIPNRLAVYLNGSLIGITIFTLILNRRGKSLTAGVILVIAGEFVVTALLVTMVPFDETSLRLFDLYVIVDLLAVSLMPPATVFALACGNSVFIGLDLVYQPHTPDLTHLLSTEFFATLIPAVGLQIIVAGVAYLWVHSVTRAVMRADRAEMIANLEHAVAEERAHFVQAKVRLEENIQQLVQTHTEAMNKQIIPRIPYSPEAKILWPLIGVINSLWVRLQHSSQVESELQHLKQAIAAYTALLDQSPDLPEQALPMYQTKTDLDTLLLALRNRQHTLSKQ